MSWRAVIAHCWTGSPEAGWYPQAAQTLTDAGIDAEVPALPDSDNPKLDAWLAALSDAIGVADESLLLIGHSLGGIALLHWLARAEPSIRIGGLLLIAPPITPTGIAEVDRFLDPAPDLVMAGQRVLRSNAIVSRLDPYLRPDPLQLSQRLLAELGAQIVLVDDRGHFSPKSGQTPLPELRDWARSFPSPRQNFRS